MDYMGIILMYMSEIKRLNLNLNLNLNESNFGRSVLGKKLLFISLITRVPPLYDSHVYHWVKNNTRSITVTSIFVCIVC